MAGGRAALLQQLEDEGLPARVVAAVAAVDRAAFVPEEELEHAWDDRALAIGGGQTISQPSLVARMCALLQLRDDERVLDVGTGSGYHAAVLSRLVAHVTSIELDPELSARAQRALARAGARGIDLVVGDGRLGHPPDAPYDAVNVAAAAHGGIPPALEEQLAPDGRLVCPVGGGEHELVVVRRTPDGLVRRQAGPVRFVPLRAPEGSGS